jgi:hypothetical protein
MARAPPLARPAQPPLVLFSSSVVPSRHNPSGRRRRRSRASQRGLITEPEAEADPEMTICPCLSVADLPDVVSGHPFPCLPTREFSRKLACIWSSQRVTQRQLGMVGSRSFGRSTRLPLLLQNIVAGIGWMTSMPLPYPALRLQYFGVSGSHGMALTLTSYNTWICAG